MSLFPSCPPALRSGHKASNKLLGAKGFELLRKPISGRSHGRQLIL